MCWPTPGCWQGTGGPAWPGHAPAFRCCCEGAEPPEGSLKIEHRCLRAVKAGVAKTGCSCCWARPCITPVGPPVANKPWPAAAAVCLQAWCWQQCLPPAEAAGICSAHGVRQRPSTVRRLAAADGQIQQQGPRCQPAVQHMFDLALQHCWCRMTWAVRRGVVAPGMVGVRCGATCMHARAGMRAAWLVRLQASVHVHAASKTVHCSVLAALHPSQFTSIL